MSALTSRTARGETAAGAAWVCPGATGAERGRPGFFVEDLDASAAEAFIRPWRDLAEHCLEPNAFFEPDFALMAAALAGPRLRFVLVWAGSAELGRELVGVVPLVLPRPGVPLPIAHLWLHKNSTCATPWLDRRHSAGVLSVTLSFCRWRWPALVGLCVGGAAIRGSFVALVRSTDVPVRFYGCFERAVLTCTTDQGPRSHRTLGKSRRRLERLGSIAYRTASGAMEVKAAVDDFLALEASGWKNGRGALANSPALSSLARSATVGLAENGRCRIVSLVLGERPIAIGIVLISARTAFFWKIAYDEAYAAFSPGALLSLELTAALLRDPAIDAADSCADAEHPMIGKIWPERLEVGTCFIGLRGRRAFRVAVAREELWLSARRRLKHIVKRLRRVQKGRGENATPPAPS